MLKNFIFAFIMFVYMCLVIFAMTACNDQGSSSSPIATLTPVSSTGSSPTGRPTAEITATPLPTPIPQPTVNPTQPLPSTPTQEPPPISVATTAAQYYQAIEAQRYAYAYSFLDPNATGLSQVAFTQMAQATDKEEGKVVSFSVAFFPPLVVMTVSRNIGPYHVHLMFRQEHNAWKIVSLDRI